MLGSSSQLDVFGFSDLHNAYLDISGLDFDLAVPSTPRQSIDDPDARRRTVLS